MGKCLLSVDWDYFIYSKKEIRGSFKESNKGLIDLWYKRYIQSKKKGRDIEKSFRLSSRVYSFWNKIKKHFKFKEGVKAYVSDSHALSYKIAKDHGCKKVYLFDAHADLGYGGLSSLDFEINCANWLGKLLKDKFVEEAHIIYSPYTTEKPEYFKPMNIFNIQYSNLNDLDSKAEVSAIHICRSGGWTPPWMDEKFNRFVNASGIPNKIIDCPKRKWDTDNISFSDHIKYLMA